MSDLTTLRDLLARVEAATADDALALEQLGGAIVAALDGPDAVGGIRTSPPHPHTRPMLTPVPGLWPAANLGDAVALVERILPGAHWSVERSGSGYWAEVGETGSGTDEDPDVPTPALALCAALLRHLIEKGERE